MYNLTASQGFCNLSTTDRPRKGNRTSGEERTHNICLLKMFIILNGWMYKDMLSFTARALAINYGTQTRKSNIAGLACKIRIDKWCLNIYILFWFSFMMEAVNHYDCFAKLVSAPFVWTSIEAIRLRRFFLSFILWEFYLLWREKLSKDVNNI